jgi:GMP synthase (glutamine-hydrolysing)
LILQNAAFPYLAAETEVLRQAMNLGVPVMGFCLGAQLMAKAWGAKVAKGPVKEIGWYRVSLTDGGSRDPLMTHFPKAFTVFQWHGDRFDLPRGAARLAFSENWPNQAMRIAPDSYGSQFHFEVTQEMILRWLRTGREEVAAMGDPVLAENILRQAATHMAPMHRLGTALFNRYLEQLDASG